MNLPLFLFGLTLAAWISLLPMARAADYDARTYEDASGKKLQYRLLSPAGYDSPANAEKRYPLVLFLHGAGERGDDNKAQLVHGCKEFLKAENRKKYPCFVLAPQCPKDEKWADVDWSSNSHTITKAPAESMRMTIEVLAKLQKEFRIDKSRLYLTGLSMGGYGTWDLLARKPKMFAAAIPICGGADESTAPKISHIPIWVFHGDKDTAVKVERSRRMVEALQKAGGSPCYTEYAGVGHDSWTRTYASGLVLDWLFAQRLP